MNRKKRRKQSRLSVNRVLKQKTVSIWPDRLISGKFGNETVEKCYASRLENCRGKISREHYISENVLKQLGNIRLSGFPWVGDRVVSLKPQALTANILCEGHNSALSPLDVFAGMLFSELYQWPKNRARSATVSGVALEKWCLKTLTGLLATGQLSDAANSSRLSKKDIPIEWLKWLYSEDPLPQGIGLYWVFNLGDKLQFTKRVQVSPLFINSNIAGLKLDFGGLKAFFSMVPKDVAFKSQHNSYNNIIYRDLTINKNPFPQEIKFKW